LNHTQLRNDIQLGKFNLSHDFGVRGAEFIKGGFYDRQGRRLTWVVGGEWVELRLRVRAAAPIRSLIVGFVVKDRQGQPLFGDNSYLTHRDDPVSVNVGDAVEFYFRFRMPVLPTGDYAVSAAISDGVQEDHVMHQWVHDALIISSRASSVATGLVGIPMLEIGHSRMATTGACNDAGK